jgi:hypothetical protein
VVLLSPCRSVAPTPGSSPVLIGSPSETVNPCAALPTLTVAESPYSAASRRRTEPRPTPSAAIPEPTLPSSVTRSQPSDTDVLAFASCHNSSPDGRSLFSRRGRLTARVNEDGL